MVETEQERRERFFGMLALRGMRGDLQLLLAFKGTEPAGQIEFHNSWFETVERYSPRKLTQHTDKIFALAGVADIVQEFVKIKFLAGIWKEHIVFNLLWTIRGVAFRRPERQIPTWSWASVDGEIANLLSELINDSLAAEDLKGNDTLRNTWEDIESHIFV